MLGKESFASDANGPAVGSASASPCVSTVLKANQHAEGLLRDRAKVIAELASRAEDIAMKLMGPYPAPAMSADTEARGEAREPRSAFEAMQQGAETVGRRVSDFDGSLDRLERALGQLSRA